MTDSTRVPEGLRSVSELILRSYWHPVATSSELRNAPLAASLLGEQIVVWRTKDKVAAFRDLCIHRGTALSLGWIQDDNLVCPYHGWTYAPDGNCVRIPSLPAGHAIPAKARATAYLNVRERYGLVWVCLAEPKAPIPEIAELEDPNYHTFFHSTEMWETSAARMIENFIDTSHFPYVHPDINATPDDPVIPEFEVKQNGFELSFETKFTAPSERGIPRAFRISVLQCIYRGKASVQGCPTIHRPGYSSNGGSPASAGIDHRLAYFGKAHALLHVLLPQLCIGPTG